MFKLSALVAVQNIKPRFLQRVVSACRDQGRIFDKILPAPAGNRNLAPYQEAGFIFFPASQSFQL